MNTIVEDLSGPAITPLESNEPGIGGADGHHLDGGVLSVGRQEIEPEWRRFLAGPNLHPWWPRGRPPCAVPVIGKLQGPR